MILKEIQPLMAKRLANGLSQQKQPRLRKLHLMPARSFDYASTAFRLKTQFFPRLRSG